jgi:hypothetical protein
MPFAGAAGAELAVEGTGMRPSMAITPEAIKWRRAGWPTLTKTMT